MIDPTEPDHPARHDYSRPRPRSPGPGELKAHPHQVATAGTGEGGTGFTAILCQDPGCAPDTGEQDAALIAALRATTRRCPHGMLVVTGCLGRAAGRCPHHGLPQPPSSRDRDHRGHRGHRDPRCGRCLIVQPCTPHARAPLGPAIPIGPLAEPPDIDTVCTWLASGGLWADRLPTRLRPAPGSQHGRRRRAE